MLLTLHSCTDTRQTIRGAYVLAGVLAWLSLSPCRAAADSPPNGRVTLALKNVPLRQVLHELERQGNVRFFYSNRQVNERMRVSIECENATMEHTLAKLFENSDITFKVVEGIIVLKKVKGLVPPPSGSPALVVSGKVTSEDGAALPGVAVIVRRSQTGTLTDAAGNYRLSAAVDDTLHFSSLGYAARQVSVRNRHTISLSLMPDQTTLDEVVVVGYGSQQRREVSSSIASVSAKEMNLLPVAHPYAALQGRISGVNVTQDSGLPGADVRVQVRGVGTINGTDPLYVVDGIPTFHGNNTLNTLDIASVEVLKDASAAGIYGSRAANGVVLVTTRKGSPGPPRISLDIYYGVQAAWRRMNLLNARQLAERSNEGNRNAGIPLVPVFRNPDSLEAAVGAGTDWQKEVFRHAPIQHYALAVSGGSARHSYLFSGGYQQQDGIMAGTGFQRLSFRLNTETRFKRFKVGENLTVGRTATQLPSGGGGGNAIQNIIKQSPHVPVRNAANPGGYGGAGAADNIDASNQVGLESLIDEAASNTRLLGSIYAEWPVTSGLVLSSIAGADVGFGKWLRFTPVYFMDKGVDNFNDKSHTSQKTSSSLGLTAFHTLTYRRAWAGHAFSAMAGMEQQSSLYESVSAYAEDLPGNSSQISSAAVRSSESDRYEWALLSFLSRATYEYGNRYFLTATVRRDGSSNFGRNYRYGLFPSVSAAWRISAEPWLAHSRFISDLKLRASWGRLGNQSGIPAYAYASTLTSWGSTHYVFNNVQVSGVAPTVLPNPDLRWETVTQTDIGLDMGLARNSLWLTFDYYHRLTNGMLVTNLPLPATSGVATAPPTNAGSVLNRGVEAAATYRKSAGEWNYSLGANLTTIRNVTLSLGNGAPLTSGAFFDNKYITRTEEGGPIGSFFGYRMAGVFRNAQEIDRLNRRDPATDAVVSYQPGAAPGDIKFEDLNQDGIVDSKDRTHLGSPIPDFFYGATASVSYKGIDFTLLVQGVQGNKIYNANRLWMEGMTRNFNSSTAVLNRWVSPEQPGNGLMPRAISTDPNQNNRESDRYLEDGSFMRVKNIQAGYSLPARWLNRLGHLTQLRFYISSQNLFTLTKYTGFDPEIGGGNLARGIDTGIYPQARTFLLGLQAGL